MEESAIIIEIGWQQRIVMGRSDPHTENGLDINLDFLNARENGVSRRHVALFWRSHVLHVEDLGSTNGTWVNGQQLAPHKPQSLGHGDVIQLGRVQLRLRFDPAGKYPPAFSAAIVKRSPASAAD